MLVLTFPGIESNLQNSSFTFYAESKTEKE